MSTIRIKTSKGIQAIVQELYESGVKSALHSRALQEKEKQASVTPKKAPNNSEEPEGEDTDLFADDDSEGGSESESQPGEVTKSSKTFDDEAEKLQNGDVTVDDVIARMNIIRSGRSFKEEHVASAMSEYVDSLSSEERVALLAFLKGISQIVTGEIEANDAIDPSEDPAMIAMQKKNAEEKKQVKPNVIKGAGDGKKKSGTEDTSAPTPITPKKRTQ